MQYQKALIIQAEVTDVGLERCINSQLITVNIDCDFWI